MPPASALPAPPWADWCEARPRDFSARFPRKGRGVGHQPVRAKRRRTLGLTALAAIALPAFVAPGQWNRFQIANAAAAEPTVQPMPFEQAGESFPGSAFYYLQADQPVPQVGEGIHSDADDGISSPTSGPTLGDGPIARPMVIDGSGTDRSRALQCLTAAVYYEAASESDAGQRAVAQVVLNRVAHPAFPNTVCGVVYEGSDRPTGCQFSFTCDGSLARRPSRLFWDRARDIARQALAGYVYAPVGLATHYHTVQVHPYWADSLHYMGTIGEHRFYSFNGAAGSPATFRYAYFGGEPMAAPLARTNNAAPDAALDPVALQRAFASPEASSGVTKVVVKAGSNVLPTATAPTPAYTSEQRERGGDSLYRAHDLPDAYGIKPEYANSGRWIAQPGS